MRTSMGLLLLSACTGGTDKGSDPTDAGEAGEITVTASVDGAVGQVMLAVVMDGSQPLATVCESIVADPDTVSGVASTFAQDNPCDLGDPVLFDAGTYTVDAGIYVPGEHEPSLCASVEVTVDGDVEAVLPAFEACP